MQSRHGFFRFLNTSGARVGCGRYTCCKEMSGFIVGGHLCPGCCLDMSSGKKQCASICRLHVENMRIVWAKPHGCFCVLHRQLRLPEPHPCPCAEDPGPGKVGIECEGSINESDAFFRIA